MLVIVLFNIIKQGAPKNLLVLNHVSACTHITSILDSLPVYILIPGKRIDSGLRNNCWRRLCRLLPLLLLGMNVLLYLLALDPIDQVQPLLIRSLVLDLTPCIFMLDIVPPVFVCFSFFAAH